MKRGKIDEKLKINNKVIFKTNLTSYLPQHPMRLCIILYVIQSEQYLKSHGKTVYTYTEK